MFKVVDLNDTGKTRKLLEECSKNNGVFICKHPERVAEKCVAYGIPVVKAYSYKDYLYSFKFVLENNGSKVYVDEIEEFLSTTIPLFSGYSLTVESK